MAFKHLFFTTLCTVSATLSFLTPLSGVFRQDDKKDAPFIERIAPSAFYFPRTFAANGNLILHDGSQWVIRNKRTYYGQNGRRIVLNWNKGDQIFIKPNRSYTDEFPYVLHNRTRREIVEVGLCLAPTENGDYTRTIESINYDTKEVQLSDGKIWKINPRAAIFKKLKTGHRLLVGVNSDWRTGKYPHILIDTGLNMAPYCEAEVR